MSAEPLRFAFGLHVHQPVGNFDSVIEEHVLEAYLPFLRSIADSPLLPITLHVSGPLLEWLESCGTDYLDLVGRLVADRQVELLFSGYYEPILVSLAREDRLEQLAWMRDYLRERFGVESTGVWLTERVWEPELATDLAEAGARYVLVDDRHFLVSGFAREQLHAPLWTEAGGRRLAALPIDERLRYLIPFRPAKETRAYLTDLRTLGHPLAIVADDGEKFGGWPGTREWVFEEGWLETFLATMEELIEGGQVLPVTMSQAVEQVESGGLAYLPTAAYREMETWALPVDAALELTALEDELGRERLQGSEGTLVRGGHWRHFLVKYPEANRMHKKMAALSALSRERGDPPEARRAIGRAQCNDAYWHGAFGGLYLPHLRRAVWSNLADAEERLRRGEAIAWERLDVDADGHDEIWVHSSSFSAIVSPARGGAIEELTVFRRGLNLADTLTRRREPYHRAGSAANADSGGPAANTGGPAADSGGPAADNGTPSIHELEKGTLTAGLPPLDRDGRALFVDRVLPLEAELDAYRAGALEPRVSWAGAHMAAEVQREKDALVLLLQGPAKAEAIPTLRKRIRFGAAGEISVTYRWDPDAFAADGFFAPELSLAEEVPLKLAPDAPVWRFPIATVVRSERDLEETVQGISLTPLWPVSAGSARVALRP